MYITIATLAISALLFAIGKMRSDIVALCALITLIVTGVLTPEEALAGFSNPVVIMMVGLFVVGGAVFQTGLAKMIGGRIVRMAGGNELRLFLLVMVTTAFIGAFVSNTGTVALMMPIVVSMAAGSGISASRLLMPLAFASSMGGMLTLIGTPPNLVVQETLLENNLEPLGFFSFAPVGLVCITTGIIVLLPLSRLILAKRDSKGEQERPSGKSLKQLTEEYRLTDKLSVYTVGSNSTLKGKTIGQLDIHNRFGLTVMEVRRTSGLTNTLMSNVTQKLAGPATMLLEGDIIYLSGEKDQAERFAGNYALTADTKDSEGQEALSFLDIGIAEIVVMPTSRLVNRLLKDAHLRSDFNVNVIGIRRNGEYIKDDLADMKLHAGDVLLIQGTWHNIARMSGQSRHWVLLGQPLEEAAKVTLSHKAPIAACIMVLMVLAMVLDVIPMHPVTAVMVAGVMMVLGGCFRNVEAAYKTINWESVVLIAAMMPMATALDKTGTSTMIAHSLVSALGSVSPTLLLAGIYVTTSLLTMFISNTATAVLMAPIALTSATELGISAYPLLMAVTVAASMCFASPFSTPPNALVMQAGRYTFADYIKVGLPLQVIMAAVMIVVLPLLFGF